MELKVFFHSYFRELSGCSETTETVAEGATLRTLVAQLQEKFPRIKPMEKSTLVAVGVEYQGPNYILQQGDEISLFPPVQGG